MSEDMWEVSFLRVIMQLSSSSNSERKQHTPSCLRNMTCAK